MNDQESIYNIFCKIEEILRGEILESQISEIRASLFFLKRLVDCSKNWNEQKWLSNYPAVEESFADFSWAGLGHERNPQQAFLAFLQAVEKAVPPLLGLIRKSSLEYFVRESYIHCSHLSEIFYHLDKFSLAEMSTSDASDFFQRLVDDMADHSAELSITPPQVRKLLVHILSPVSGSTIYDPACGSASLLCDAARWAKTNNNIVRLYGQDLREGIALIARMNAIIGNWDADIRTGNTITLPKHLTGNRAPKFDIILAHPPFGLRVQEDDITPDQLRRFETALPRTSELAFLQHIEAFLSDSGRAAVILPNGLLSRKGSDHKVRKDLIDSNRIRAVIKLPRNLFPGTAIAASVVLFSGRHEREAGPDVIFVDISSFAEGRKTRAHLSETGVTAALDALRDRQFRKGISSLIPPAQIIENDYDLSVSHYVHLTSINTSFEDDLELFLSSLSRRNEAEQKFMEAFKALSDHI